MSLVLCLWGSIASLRVVNRLGNRGAGSGLTHWNPNRNNHKIRTLPIEEKVRTEDGSFHT